ncbi:hypothetical protein GQ53DRAFT_149424 [Thozetella sp. PMI_491]|nr:hypothetical protein GQ53DRAFT_149424 [Thozetella sp. PMI_491]
MKQKWSPRLLPGATTLSARCQDGSWAGNKRQVDPAGLGCPSGELPSAVRVLGHLMNRHTRCGEPRRSFVITRRRLSCLLCYTTSGEALEG